MRGEQCLGADVTMDVLDHGPGEREAVISGGPAADFVQHDQAARRGGVQDHRGLGHLHHERGTAAREIIRRADAREHAIDDRNQRGFGRHERTHLRQDRQAARPAADTSICRPCSGPVMTAMNSVSGWK